MQVRFARRMGSVRASAIRELLKLAVRPELISFAGGLPAPELFPASELARLAARLLEREPARALQYSTSEGEPGLRRAIAAHVNRRFDAGIDADEVLVTTGSQQGLDLCGKLLLDEGDAVLCESPTYLGALSAWNLHRPRFVEVATDEEGMEPAALERALTTTPRVKLVYAIPDFQNPTGRCWSLARRRAALELCARHEVPLVEDNPYGELRFEGEHLPSLLALGGGEGVIGLGTFSKLLCPGLRIGWIAARRELLDRLTILKQGADLHTSTLDQLLVEAYLAEVDLDARVAGIVALYRVRRDAMLAALARELPASAQVAWTRPAGGLFLWLTLPPPLDGAELLAAALAEGVAFVPGGAFFPSGGHPGHARLNYSLLPSARIEAGIARLARVIARASDRERALAS